MEGKQVETGRAADAIETHDGPAMSSLWRGLSWPHRRWLILNALLGTAVVNMVLTSGIAWLSASSEKRVPLWPSLPGMKPSTVTDTVGTFFVLPFLTCLIVTTIVRRDQRAGRLAPLGRSHPLLARLPAMRLRRALVLGGLCIAALGPLSIVVLVAIDFGNISLHDFVLYKGLLGVALGAIVTPVVAVAAMADLAGARADHSATV